MLHARSMRLSSQKWLKTRMDTACLICFFSLFMHGLSAHAQTPALDSARALLAKRDFAQAERILRAESAGPIRDTLLAQSLITAGDTQTNPERTAEALGLLERAASAGYPEATYPLASIVASSGRIADARQLLQPLAEKNDPRALYLLGRINEAVRDYINAARFYERSAHLGNADALNNLGYMHANGLGIARDDTRAARYYREAITAGSLEAGINLAALIDANRAALADGETREKLLEPAAQVGQPVALRMLGRAATAAQAPTQPAAPATPAIALAPPRLSAMPAPRATAPAPIAAAAPLAAISSPPPASTEPSVPPPPPQLSAAQAAEIYAQAIRLQRGEGAVRDLTRAAELLEHAASAGLADAQRALADVYDYGLGVASNPRKAIELRKAAAGR
jgi:uncharacterized protein